MKTKLTLSTALILSAGTVAFAAPQDQEKRSPAGKSGEPAAGETTRDERSRRSGRGARPTDIGAAPLDLGAPGIAWYGCLDTALAEARRSNRPIMFMSAASQCSGVPGVF